MDITICITSFNRKSLLLNTLESFKRYDSNRFNVVIVDDCSDESELLTNEEIFSYDFKVTYLPIKSNNQWWICPVVPLKIVTTLVDTPKMIIQHAECSHNNDIFKVIDEELGENDYIAFSCFALNQGVDVNNFTLSDGSWYCHSVHNQRPLHFCCAIHTDKFKLSGGYDLDMAKGFWYDDDMFLKSLNKIGVNVKISDSGMVLHQYHDSKWDTPNFEELRLRNWEIFNSK